MARRMAAALVGVVFGATLSWSGMTSPDVIRQGLLFQHAYLFLFFASAVAVAFAGQRVLRALHLRAPLAGERVGWSPLRPQRRHIVGSLVFGVGWGIADACPGPVATQVGQGIAWGLLTLAGMVIGLRLYARRERAREERPVVSPGRLATQPAGD